MPKLRIYADFNRWADADTLDLMCYGTIKDIVWQLGEIRQDLPVIFYTNDTNHKTGLPDLLLIDGIIYLTVAGWRGKVDFGTIRHESGDEPPHDPNKPFVVREFLGNSLGHTGGLARVEFK